MVNKSSYTKDVLNSLGSKGVYGSFGNDYFKSDYINKNLIGKAGRLNRVSSFAGYIKNSKGETIAFSIIINNHSGTRAQINEYIESRISELI